MNKLCKNVYQYCQNASFFFYWSTSALEVFPLYVAAWLPHGFISPSCFPALDISPCQQNHSSVRDAYSAKSLPRGSFKEYHLFPIVFLLEYFSRFLFVLQCALYALQVFMLYLLSFATTTFSFRHLVVFAP